MHKITAEQVDAILLSMDDKQNIRASILARRDELTVEERSRKSLQICLQLERVVEKAHAARTSADFGADASQSTGPVAHGQNRLPRVAVYAPMRSEVALDAFVETAYARGWDVCFPCMVREAQGEPSRMAFYQVPRERLGEARAAFLDHPLRCLSCDHLTSNGYASVEPNELDAVAVPLVAFDNEGRRLGYGGGNYDRLLPLLRDDALVVGVAFEEQRVPAVPTEPHDQPLPFIVCA